MPDRITGYKLCLLQRGGQPFFAPLVFALLLSALSLSCGNKVGAVAADALSGYCPVCGMIVKSEDPWSSEIYYSDGTKLIFETVGDMASFYSSPERYGANEVQKDRSRIEKILAKDYLTKEPLDVRHSPLVYKSSVNGPMGPDLIAFGSQKGADSFAAANGGKVVKLDEVTQEMVQNLRKK